jgi:ubiquinone/menaquinone biosynthesis C-methylase UbiE
MNPADTEALRIAAEYQRRKTAIALDYYSWAKPANLLLYEQTHRSCVRMLSRASLFPPVHRRILDIGCGSGGWLLGFAQWGADPACLSGIDLSLERVRTARLRLPRADIRLGNAAKLPWGAATFDLVTQFTVFTSILKPEVKREVAAEMVRVLKPGGCILWFDFRVNNPSNPNVRGIGAAEISDLFPSCGVQLEPVLLAPPLARSVAAWSRPLAELLHSIPFLRTHYTGLIRKPAAPKAAAAGEL